MKSQFTKTPTITNESRINNNFQSNQSYSNETNRLFFNQQTINSNNPYILLTGVNNDNALKLYNFFQNIGIIQDYIKKQQDSSMLLKYKSPESIRRALSVWESDRLNYPEVKLSIIQEEEKNQLYQKENDYSTQYSQKDPMNYLNNQLPSYVDNKSLKEKFIDVFLNI